MAVVRYAEPVIIHDSHGEDESTLGFVTGIVILVALLGLFFYYLLPYVQNAFTPAGAGASQVNVQVGQ